MDGGNSAILHAGSGLHENTYSHAPKCSRKIAHMERPSYSQVGCILEEGLYRITTYVNMNGTVNDFIVCSQLTADQFIPDVSLDLNFMTDLVRQLATRIKPELSPV